jgi:hypothetical protein
MQIGIGLQNTLPGTPEWMLVDWNRKAETPAAVHARLRDGSQRSRSQDQVSAGRLTRCVGVGAQRTTSWPPACRSRSDL